MKANRRTNSKANYDKAKVMKRAWAILRKEGAENITWSECLIQSWNIEKNGTANVTIEFIYTEYYKQILNLVRAKTNYSVESEEITNDVFLKANEHLAKYDVLKAKVTTWLYTIATNKVIDWYRANKHSNKIAHVNGWVDSEGNETYQFEGSVYTETVETHETQEQIKNAMSYLNEKEQAIAVMYFLDDKQYNEIAELLEIPMGSVKGTISRIRVKLQNKLKNVYTQ